MSPRETYYSCPPMGFLCATNTFLLLLVYSSVELCASSLQDNLYPNEIDEIVYETMSGNNTRKETKESMLAAKLLAAAYDRSTDTDAECPFVDEARAEVRCHG